MQFWSLPVFSLQVTILKIKIINKIKIRFKTGALGGGPACGNFIDLAKQLTSYLQNQYLNIAMQYSTSPPNVQISQVQAMTDALLTVQSLSAQDRSTLTAIKNGGDVAALCVFNFFDSLV